ncbi:MAG: type II toxin-antitoxin system VapB family antitoxin [Deltaproteobacteria bacterium]|nr:type II toxin-antitoxin system VapB family antitoxin [Deltaproteobacteria bacterium]
MPTNLAIDDSLLNRALKVSSFRTKRETVNVALQEFIERREQKKILRSLGTIEFRKNWNYKKERKGREYHR